METTSPAPCQEGGSLKEYEGEGMETTSPAPLGRRSPQGLRGLAEEICVFLKEYEGQGYGNDLPRRP